MGGGALCPWSWQVAAWNTPRRLARTPCSAPAAARHASRPQTAGCRLRKHPLARRSPCWAAPGPAAAASFAATIPCAVPSHTCQCLDHPSHSVSCKPSAWCVRELTSANARPCLAYSCRVPSPHAVIPSRYELPSHIAFPISLVGCRGVCNPKRAQRFRDGAPLLQRTSIR